jgi:L-rhamnose mutarotase
MVLETGEEFSFEKKLSMDIANPKVQEWEKLMWKFQKPVPGAKPGEKWVLMDKIFELKA